jgi:hypothetical protein
MKILTLTIVLFFGLATEKCSLAPKLTTCNDQDGLTYCYSCNEDKTNCTLVSTSPNGQIPPPPTAPPVLR